MFAARGVAVSFSVFVMVYCGLSLAVSLGWPSVRLHMQRQAARRIADLLFALRMLPLLTAAAITAALTIPSFLLLEPRAIAEPLSEIPLILGIFGAGLGILGVTKVGIALRRTARTLSRWTVAAQPVASCINIPVLRISPSVRAAAVPAITAAGILRPKVLLSGAAESILTPNELQTALKHELAHVRRRDNLKKLLLRLVAFPGMAGLEAAWLAASEMAADDAAVANAGEALDLAATLIKLSRVSSAEPTADLTAALVHNSAAIIRARIERLIAWSDARLISTRRISPWYGLGAALVTIAIFGVTYSQLLAGVHTATEWLVR